MNRFKWITNRVILSYDHTANRDPKRLNEMFPLGNEMGKEKFFQCLKAMGHLKLLNALYSRF